MKLAYQREGLEGRVVGIVEVGHCQDPLPVSEEPSIDTRTQGIISSKLYIDATGSSCA